MADWKNQIDNITTHIEVLIEQDVLEKIGADEGDDRPLHLRVMRILDAYNDLQAENKQQADLLVLAKEEMDAQATEIKRLKELIVGATLDYGYANGWGATPKLIRECREKKHKTHHTSLGNFDNVVWCEICEYKYRYDSS